MMNIPYKKSKRGVVLNVRVDPRSSKAEVIGVVANSLKVKLTAPPAGGAANKQLIEVLSEFFTVKKSSIHIIKGRSSKNKVVELEGIERLY